MFTRTTIISGLATIVALGVSAGPAMAHPFESAQASAPAKQQISRVDKPAALPKGVVLRRTTLPGGFGHRGVVVVHTTPVVHPDDRADRGIPATRIVPQQTEASDSSGFSNTDIAVICGVILAALAAMWLATRRIGGERFAQ
jgi:hypothetical protein